MVLTDMILREKIGMEIFLLDTGRLPVETYDLLAKVWKSSTAPRSKCFTRSTIWSRSMCVRMASTPSTSPSTCARAAAMCARLNR